MIASALISALSEHGQTVAVAESLTGGMLCSTLVEVPGASMAVRGGIVAYATELKHRLLDVDRELLAANGPVDPDVAAQMALGVRRRLSADWGLATTGVAGPDPQDGIAPGRVYVAVAGPLGSGVETRVVRLDLPGDRMAVRTTTTELAVGALLAAVVGAGVGGEAAGDRAEHGDVTHR